MIQTVSSVCPGESGWNQAPMYTKEVFCLVKRLTAHSVQLGSMPALKIHLA